jgi:RNA polymerase sigma-70 factor (ECF subfamily)
MNRHVLKRAETHVIRDKKGTERRFEALYSAHYQAIAGYVLRRVAADEADDVIAQVFTVAWRRFGEVPPPPGDRLWLFGVARNTVSDQRRSERRQLHLHARLTQDAATTASRPVAPDHPADEQVHAALDALRPADREALQLVLWDELTHAEAAAVLGCSPNAFGIRYRRARQAAREAVIATRAVVPVGQDQLAYTKSRTTPS